VAPFAFASGPFSSEKGSTQDFDPQNDPGPEGA
jgi:hypothetical protein